MAPNDSPDSLSGLMTREQIAVFYATRDGQARRIAVHIAGCLQAHGISTTLRDLANDCTVPAEAALAVVLAAVRYGRHLPEAEQFLAAYHQRPAPPPLAFISVNLTARKPGRDAVATNQYLRKSLARYGLAPVLAAAVAGRLDYPRYGWLDRQIIRLIMKLTGGPTDPTACVEFTDWRQVDAIAVRLAGCYCTVVCGPECTAIPDLAA